VDSSWRLDEEVPAMVTNRIVVGVVSEECVRKATGPVVVIPVGPDTRPEPAEPAVSISVN
jgi:hypothetical protein